MAGVEGKRRIRSYKPGFSMTLDEVISDIEEEGWVWVRFAAVVEKEGWHVRALEATGGEPPAGWQHRVWEYPNALFVALEEPGQALAGRLRDREFCTHGRQVCVPRLNDQVTWERRQSRSTGIYQPLDWPVMEAPLSMNAAGPEPQGHLIGEEQVPSFFSFGAAATAFFSLEAQPGPGSMFGTIQYRHQDRRARINRVRISATEVTVDLEGEDLDRLTVELAGDAPGLTKEIYESYQNGNIREREELFTLPDGLPPGSWILLRRQSQWLDRRFLSVPWSRGREAGVEVISDPATRLESLVGAGERQIVEFKRQVPKDDETKIKTMKTVCAFANGEGGSILFGVDDERVIVGLDPGSLSKIKDQLTQMVGSWVDPRPPIDFKVLPVPDSAQAVLELVIATSHELYGCGRPGEVPLVYVRHHGVTERAGPAEIRGIVQSRSSPAMPSWLP